LLELHAVSENSGQLGRQVEIKRYSSMNHRMAHERHTVIDSDVYIERHQIHVRFLDERADSPNDLNGARGIVLYSAKRSARFVHINGLARQPVHGGSAVTDNRRERLGHLMADRGGKFADDRQAHGTGELGQCRVEPVLSILCGRDIPYRTNELHLTRIA
jgi:hypothetical protein